jgi:hypothetical protein
MSSARSTGLLARTAGLFVAPGPARAAAAPSPFPPRALVIGGRDEAPALGAAVAGELRARRGAPAALLTIWSQDAARAGSLAAAPGARALASRLVRRDIEAAARGRLAWTAVGGEPREALGAALRAAAAVDVPAVLAIAGPRPSALDELLGEFDLIVIAESDEDSGAAALAASDLAAGGVGAVTCRPPRDASRLVALAGWGRLHADGGVSALVAELA